MLELIMVLSVVLGKYSDLAVVGALLVVNAVLGFTQEHRAAGVVEALRRRLQVSARVLRDRIGTTGTLSFSDREAKTPRRTEGSRSRYARHRTAQ